MLAVLFFKYTNDNQSNHTNLRHQHRKWTREDNKVLRHCYFGRNPTHRKYRKRMIEILEEYSRFKTTGRRLADQVRTMRKKVCFSDHEILEIH